jgi:hypothetical protein
MSLKIKIDIGVGQDSAKSPFSALSINTTNSVITLSSSKGMYASNGSSPVLYTYFDVLFSQNSDNAYSVVLNSVQKVGGGALTGGETSIEMLITVYGRQDGLAQIVIKAKQNSIYTSDLKPFNTIAKRVTINALSIATSTALIGIKADNNVYTDNGVTLATDGQTVQQITDIFSGKRFRQETAGNKPILKTNILNGNSVIRFTTDDYMDSIESMGLNGDSITAIVFAKSTVDNLAPSLFTSDKASVSSGRIQMIIDTRAYVAGSVPIIGLMTNSVPTTYNATGTHKLNIDQFYCQACIFNRGTSIKGYIDGILNANTSTSGSFVKTDAYRLGTNGSKSSYFNGDLAAIYIWNRALTDSEISSFSEELNIYYLGLASGEQFRTASFNVYLGLDAIGSNKYNAINAHLKRVNADLVTFTEISNTNSDAFTAICADNGLSYKNTGIDFTAFYIIMLGSKYPIYRNYVLTNSEFMFPIPVTVVKIKNKILFIYSIHLYPIAVSSWTPNTPIPAFEYTRAIQHKRIKEDILAKKAVYKNAAFVIQGDYNQDDLIPQTDHFDSKPSGVPVTVVEDFGYPVQYATNPYYAMYELGFTIAEGTTLSGNRNTVNANSPNASITSEVRIDFHAYNADKLNLLGNEILFSEDDANTGLTKVGSPLASNLSRIASDHRLVFSDFEII